MTQPPEEHDALVVLRCRRCGDTFPVESKLELCPSCGSDEVDVAHEPLL